MIYARIYPTVCKIGNCYSVGNHYMYRVHTYVVYYIRMKPYLHPPSYVFPTRLLIHNATTGMDTTDATLPIISTINSMISNVLTPKRSFSVFSIVTVLTLVSLTDVMSLTSVVSSLHTLLTVVSICVVTLPTYFKNCYL